MNKTCYNCYLSGKTVSGFSCYWGYPHGISRAVYQAYFNLCPHFIKKKKEVASK